MHTRSCMAHARSSARRPGTALADLLEPTAPAESRWRADRLRSAVALLFLSSCTSSPTADPAGIIARLLAPFPAGSTSRYPTPPPTRSPQVNNVERVFDEATTPAHVRSRAEIAKLVTGMEIIEPGLAWPPQWRPDPGEEVPANAAESYYCVMVARTT